MSYLNNLNYTLINFYIIYSSFVHFNAPLVSFHCIAIATNSNCIVRSVFCDSEMSHGHSPTYTATNIHKLLLTGYKFYTVFQFGTDNV